ncbi:ribosomal protein L7/L12 [Streptomyces sp. NPDC058293]|uniref:Ribosomal protein L7/L12 n=1 Tax=Streptomyces sp. NBC_00119 TaxID=2975659 RepID=A0AAU1UBP0_9ACTN|nr:MULTISPECIES: ribosomal protein L7/L12 [unclassified Streptomyces]MCX4645690.1 ribosomal protein L7/L12 [Streptomyces sp. NBC_01446]MCX5318314.1 ribosomal protein L7/L12 [Streptomyces sp. NBC_00120]
MEILGVGATLVVLVSIGGIESRIKRTDRRISRVEHKIDLILDHLGLCEVDPELEQVATHLRNGKKIQAIKVYREITGAGLKEAKDAVDRMA